MKTAENAQLTHMMIQDPGFESTQAARVSTTPAMKHRIRREAMFSSSSCLEHNDMKEIYVNQDENYRYTYEIDRE